MRPAVGPRLRIAAAVVRPKLANRVTTNRRVKPKNINVLATAVVTTTMMMMMTTMTMTIVIRNIRADRVVPNEVAIRVGEGLIRGIPETMIEIESIRTDPEIGPGQDLAIGTSLPGGDPGVGLDPRRGEDIREVSWFAIHITVRIGLIVSYYKWSF